MDKMREEFEAWWISKNPTNAGIGSHWYENGYWVNSNSIYSGVELQWEAWKASRAALCVELDEIRSKIKSECEKSDYMKSVCRQIIDDIDSIQIERF